MSDTLILTIILVPTLIMAIVCHEVAHGYVAMLLGDPTARDQRRLSLNPLRHVDPVGTLVVPGLLALSGAPVFGWAKPVPVVQQRLRNPRYGMMAVAAAGPATNFLLATLGALALGLVTPHGGQIGASQVGLPMIYTASGAPSYAATAAFFFILINLFLGIFNLLPIPPFDGSHILEGLLPRDLARGYRKLRPYGMVLFFGLVMLVWLAPGLGIWERVIVTPVYWALGKFLALANLV